MVSLSCLAASLPAGRNLVLTLTYAVGTTERESSHHHCGSTAFVKKHSHTPCPTFLWQHSLACWYCPRCELRTQLSFSDRWNKKLSTQIFPPRILNMILQSLCEKNLSPTNFQKTPENRVFRKSTLFGENFIHMREIEISHQKFATADPPKSGSPDPPKIA